MTKFKPYGSSECDKNLFCAVVADKIMPNFSLPGDEVNFKGNYGDGTLKSILYPKTVALMLS